MTRYTIKPLVWNRWYDPEEAKRVMQARCLLGVIKIRKLDNGMFRWVFPVLGGRDYASARTLREAKQQAEENWKGLLEEYLDKVEE